MNLKAGQIIHGFAGGAFGRDSYRCRVVEAVGLDWVVARAPGAESEFAHLSRLSVEDVDDRSWCCEECTA